MEKKFSYKTFAQRRVAEGRAFLTSLIKIKCEKTVKGASNRSRQRLKWIRMPLGSS